MRRYLLAASASLSVTLGLLAPAQATYIVTLEQVGANVVANGSGSLDITGMNIIEPQAFFDEVEADAGLITFGFPNPGFYYGASISGPTDFGTGSSFFGIEGNGNIVGIDGSLDLLAVEQGYVSGDDLFASTATWFNETFASMGVAPGTYDWTWSPTDSAVDDNFILQIGSAAAGVPEPITLSIFSAGIAGAVTMRRRKARRT